MYWRRPRLVGLLLLGVVFLGAGQAAKAAYISEIDQGGPAGRGVELSGLDPVHGATLLMIDANIHLPQAFGRVLDVLHVPGSAGVGGVVMVTESQWFERKTALKAIHQLSPDSGAKELNFHQTRLLVMMSGDSEVRRFDRPMTLADARARYDASLVTDWLVLGRGDLTSRYTVGGYEISRINTIFGIDLLSRLVDKDAGRIIARAKQPGRPLVMDTFVTGNPGLNDRFVVGPHLDYLYTPGSGNLPLIVTAPEPAGAFGFLVLGLCLLMRRVKHV